MRFRAYWASPPPRCFATGKGEWADAPARPPGAAPDPRRCAMSRTCPPPTPNATPRQRTAALRRAFLEAVSEEQLSRMVGKLLERACEGELPAIRLVLQYTLGRTAA